ncbi:MAG: phospholipase [Pseudonocardiales bacterium]|nr:phospholipase [Pseudonocardiales bacterium]
MPETVPHVVVFVQENHTTDNYFASMRGFGANVAAGWPVQSNPPAHDQAHTRAAYAKWLHAQQTAPLRRWHTPSSTTSLVLNRSSGRTVLTSAFVTNQGVS